MPKKPKRVVCDVPGCGVSYLAGKGMGALGKCLRHYRALRAKKPLTAELTRAPAGQVSRERISYSLPPELIAKVAKAAKARKVSASSVVSEALAVALGGR